MRERHGGLVAHLDEHEPPDDGVIATREINLRIMREALARHRLFWVTCALLGLIIGASFHLIVPSKYVGVTTLYLAQPTTGGTYSIADDVSLLDTTKVAERALHLMAPSRARSLPGTYGAVALGSVLLEVRADGSTPAEARLWAGALARAFLAVRAEVLTGQTRLVVSALLSQVRALEVQVRRLNRTITGLSAATGTPAGANQEAQLVSERGADQSQLLSIQAEIQQDHLAEDSVTNGSYVLDPPLAIVPSKKRIFAEDGLSGLVAGLALGIGVLVLGSVVSDRPRRRAEIAMLLQAPVLASIRRRRPLGRKLRATLGRRRMTRPSKAMHQAQGAVVATLDNLQPPALALVAIGKGSARPAAVIVARSALAMAKSGRQVLAVDLTDDHTLATVLRVRARQGARREVSRGNLRFSLVVGDLGGVADPRAQSQGADAVIILANADPAIGMSHLSAWVVGAVTLIRTGKVSGYLLDGARQMLEAAGVPNLGCIMLDADRSDETFGTAGGDVVSSHEEHARSDTAQAGARAPHGALT